MFEYYRVDLDTKDFQFRISRLDMEMKGKGRGIARKMTAAVAKEIRKDSRRKARAESKRTGELAKSIGYKAYNDFSADIYAKKFYASFLEKGVTITPRSRKRKYLVFRINGEWKKVTSVTIAPRPFLKPVIDGYYGGSGKAEKIMEDELQKALDDIMGKEK